MGTPAALIFLLSSLVPDAAQAARGEKMSHSTAQPPSAPSERPIEITRGGELSAQPGAASFFTGSVRVVQLFKPNDPSRTSGGRVTFEPGARSAWHTHPLGQTLIVTAGAGRVQRWGSPAEEILAGDVVWIPPGVKHWHGAAPEAALTHLAIQEVLDGKNVEWLEKVSDEQYAAATPPARRPAQALSPLAPAASVELAGDGALAVPARGARRLGDAARRGAPALERYTRDVLYGQVLQRPGLSPRDRKLVTLAALIARNQTAALHEAFSRALDEGLKPSEVSEVITHLAFYSGWANAEGAAAAAGDVFAQRGIATEQLTANGSRLPLDEAAEARRAQRVEAEFGAIAPGVVQYTTEVLFRDLWLRPGLAPRDRSLITVSALIASGQVAQVTYHLGRAMDAGLTRAEASEAVTQLAFYAGWPNVFSALPVIKEVFEKRAK
jgi:4-carboxymuconolactone decarboxylase